jgi:catechol 2,3-dioxygenase-like lactoylglutathione lyase family enzyme
MAASSPAAAVFESITLIVSDLEAATRFYRQVLRLELIREFPGDYASLQLPGGLVLGLHVPHEGHAHRMETAGIEIGFLVEDVDAWHGRLSTSGVRFFTGPTDMPWGRREAQLADPDGHVVTLKGAAQAA